jgi:DHA2 family lincomycin resistance protein-like MFS transporter
MLAAVGFGGLVYGLSSLGEAARGHVPVPPAVPLVVGAVFLGLFVVRQLRLQRADVALLDLRVFKASGFSPALGAMAVSMLAMFGALILLPLLLQDALGLEPLATGLLVLPGGLAMGLLGPVIGNLYDRIGPRPLVLPGTVAVVVALAGMSTVTPTTSPFVVLAAHVVMSLGLALVFTPLFTAALGALTPNLYSHGSAAIGTVQQLAGAAGTAMFVAVFTARSVSLSDDGTSAASALTGGSQLAFIAGAAVMVVAVGLAFLVRKPAETEGGPAFH